MKLTILCCSRIYLLIQINPTNQEKYSVIVKKVCLPYEKLIF